MRQIALQPSPSRGSFDRSWLSDLTPQKLFAMRLDPDGRLLVLRSKTSGEWSLLRLTGWWTEAPVTEALGVPGWAATEGDHLDRMYIDVQITPDGRYAVAFAGATWMSRENFLLHVPRGYVMRPPDTIVTVVDLSAWRVVGSLHTAAMGSAGIRGVRVAESGAIETSEAVPGYFVSRLQVPPVTSQTIEGKPVQALSVLVERGRDTPPAEVLGSSRSGLRSLDEFYRHWGEYPYYLLYAENPPLESFSRNWYALFDPPEPSAFYHLDTFDAAGRKQGSRLIPHTLCGDPALDRKRSACGCRVIDVAEAERHVLSFCRLQRGDYLGTVQREWLSVLNLDDLATGSYIDLPQKDRQTLQQRAEVGGHSYVITLESGEIVRVYRIPDRR